MKLKKTLLVLLAVFSLNLSTMACFYDDPSAYIGTQTIVNAGGEGDGAWMENWDISKALQDFWAGFAEAIARILEAYGILVQTAQSFPMTLNTEFTGFADGSRVTRACLLYLNRDGYWIILKDIQNPVWDIATNTGKSRALFGKNCVPSSMGYKFGEVLTIRTYYKSDTQETFNLEEALKTRVTDRAALENVLNIYVHYNTTPE